VKKIVTSFVLGGIIGAIVGALWIGPERVGELSEADVSSIESFHERWIQAEQANDWEGVAALLEEDVVMLPPGHPVMEGKATYLEYVNSFVEEYGATVSDFTADAQVIDGCRNLAILRGTWSHTMTVAGAAEPVTEAGKHIVVLARQPDGSWLVREWIWNSDRAPGAET
jgi:uncharacterized protein (TIGR02246 family)